MKVLVVYDSTYGNTEQIARAIGGAFTGDVKVLRAEAAGPEELASLDLLIVGCPTQAFRHTKPIQTFLENLPNDAVKGLDVAAFDTRIPESEVGRGLRFLMRRAGYAAPRIAKALTRKGGNPVVPPEGFFVKDKEGPLSEGELERAAGWAQGILQSRG